MDLKTNEILFLLCSLQKLKGPEKVIFEFLKKIQKLFKISIQKINEKNNEYDFKLKSKNKSYGKYKIDGEHKEESLNVIKQAIPILETLLENITIKNNYKHEIKQLKNKTRSLKLSEERLNYAFNAVNDAIWDWKYDEGIIYWSPSYLKMLGYKNNEFKPSLNIWAKLIHPEDYPETEKKFLNCINNLNCNYEHEARFKTKNNEWKWLLTRGDVVQRDKSGSALRIIGTFIDINARKLAEEALKESEEKFRSLAEESPNMIFINQNGKIVYTNKICETYSLYTRDEFYDEKFNFLTLIVDDQIDLIKKNFAKHQSGMDIKPYEYRLVCKNGKNLDVIINTKLILYNQQPAILGIVTDITDRKKAEENLLESEEGYRSTIDSMADNIHVVDKNLDIQLINNSFKKLNRKTGLKTNVIGKNVFEVYPFLNKKVRDEYNWVFKNKKTLITEEKVIIRNKQYITETRKIPIIKHDEVTGIITAMRDISEIKKTEHELKNFIANLEAMIENTDDYIMIADEKGFTVMFNKNYKKIIERILDIKIKPGIKPHKFLKNKNAVKLWDHLHKRVLAGERLKQEFSINIDNEERYFESSFVPVKEDNKISGFAEHIKDITHIKKHETDLIEAKKKAEESDRLKSAFLANMSHEIRTPMNGIIGFAELLCSHDLNIDIFKKYAHIIRNSSNQLLTIINEIIDISKIEAGEININEQQFELISTLFEIYNFHYPAVSKKGVDLYFDNFEDEYFHISTDKTKLCQILNNLIDNARKFTSTGTINFGFTIHNNIIEFYVKDTGIGILKKDKEIIFKRFRQSNALKNNLIRGTGLGLPISKAYIEKLGGKIWVESKYKAGTDFYFTIPLKKIKNLEKSNTGNAEKEGINAKVKIILIVEDDDTNYLLLKEILTKYNINHLRAIDGEEAIKICKNNPNIDLVLMDLKLPKKDGYSATKEIKRMKSDLPVIAQTAYALAGDKEKALKAGCDDYIEKPIKENNLIRLIKKYLDH